MPTMNTMYLKAGGQKCPVCREKISPGEIETSRVGTCFFRKVYCPVCQAQWEEVFRRVEITDVIDGNGTEYDPHFHQPKGGKP